MNRKFFLIITVLIIPFLFAGCSLKKPAALTTTTTTKKPIQTTGKPTIITTSSVTTTALAITNNSGGLLATDPASFDNALSANFNLAQAKSKEWNKDAVFYGMIVKVPEGFKKDNSTQTYVFGSPKDKFNWWTYTYEEPTKKSFRAVIPKDDLVFDKNAPPAKVEYWKTNYIKALQSAMKDYGIKTPIGQTVLTLENTQPKGWLWWSTDFQDQSGKSIKTVLVEPASGQVADAGGEIKQLSNIATTTTVAPIIQISTTTPYLTATTTPESIFGASSNESATSGSSTNGSYSGSNSYSGGSSNGSSSGSNSYSGGSYYNLTTAPDVATGGVTKNTLQAIKDGMSKNWVVIAIGSVAVIIIIYLIYSSFRKRNEDEGDLDIPF